MEPGRVGSRHVRRMEHEDGVHALVVLALADVPPPGCCPSQALAGCELSLVLTPTTSQGLRTGRVPLLRQRLCVERRESFGPGPIPEERAL